MLLALSIARAAVGEQILGKLSALIKWLMEWALKLCLYLFTGYMAITGVVSGTADAAAGKAARIAISGAVPVVGGILSDAADAVLLSAAALGSGDSWLSFRGRYEEPAAHTCRAQQKSQLHWLSGRAQPLSTALGCWEISHEFAFSLRPDELPLLEKLKALSGSVLVYKDARGDLAKGVLREVKSVHRGTHVDLSFTLTEAEQEGTC